MRLHRRRVEAARKTSGAAVVALVAAFAGAAGDASENEGSRKRERPETTEQAARNELSEPAQRSRVSVEDATAIVRQAYGGRVVSAGAATARPAPGRPKESGYRVRVDVDGRVKTVFVDARGRIHENAEY